MGLVRRRALAAVVGGLASFGAVTPARADDLFEIEVFHVRVNQPGEFGIEWHSNYVPSGVARDAPEVSPNHVLYEMLEPTYGLTKYWEIGAHIQETARPTGPDWGGAKLRTMFVIPTTETFPPTFGINFEGGYTPPEYDPGVWVLEIRPVAEWRAGAFDFDLNPILDINFEGPSAGVPRFEPAAAARYTVLGSVDLGVEYYADFGPVSGFDPIPSEGHYVFETLDLVRWPEWRVRAGLGEGLTSGSNPLTVTTILGHFF